MPAPSGSTAREPVDDPEVVDELAALAAHLRMELARLNRLLRQHVEGGLTASQLSALAAVGHHGPLRLGELARLEAVAPPTLTKVVVGLERLGLVARSPDPTDGRSALVEATEAGRAALASNRGQRTAFLVGRLAGLTPEERDVLLKAVNVLARVTDDTDAS